MSVTTTPPCRALVALTFVSVAFPVQGQTHGRALDRMVEELLPRVEQVSGLKALVPLTVAPRSRAELRAHLDAAARRDVAEGQYRETQMVYRLLRLLPDTLELESYLPQLMTDQIAGYYDPRTDTLFILDDVPDASVRGIVAHEMTHALQDQHFQLDSLVRSAGDNDALLALRAAVEGHATLVMLFIQMEDILGRPVSIADLPDFTRMPLEAMMPGRPSPEFMHAPRVLRETGAFPYGRGLGFAHAIRTRNAAALPFGALMPRSTEQVIEPYGRFLDERDEPLAIRFEEGETPGWSVVYENTLGRFELSILLMERHRLQSESLANAWSGDRYRLLSDGEHYALEWFIAWDDSRAASTFVNVYKQILRTRMGKTATVERADVKGRAIVRVVEAGEGVEVSSVPRATLLLGGR